MPGNEEFLKPWLEAWYLTAEKIFMESYLKAAGNASFIPENNTQLYDLLAVYIAEKAIYELDYEFNNRPDWIHIPLSGLKMIMDQLAEKENRHD